MSLSLGRLDRRGSFDCTVIALHVPSCVREAIELADGLAREGVLS